MSGTVPRNSKRQSPLWRAYNIIREERKRKYDDLHFADGEFRTGEKMTCPVPHRKAKAELGTEPRLPEYYPNTLPIRPSFHIWLAWSPYLRYWVRECPKILSYWDVCTALLHQHTLSLCHDSTSSMTQAIQQHQSTPLRGTLQIQSLKKRLSSHALVRIIDLCTLENSPAYFPHWPHPSPSMVLVCVDGQITRHQPMQAPLCSVPNFNELNT